MADLKISDLPAVSSLTGDEIIPVVQGGVNKRVAAEDLVEFLDDGQALPDGGEEGQVLSRVGDEILWRYPFDNLDVVNLPIVEVADTEYLFCVYNGALALVDPASITANPGGTLKPENLSLPIITGTVGVASTVTSSTGVWKYDPTLYTYQWYADEEPIDGADTASYSITQEVIGAALTVVVTASNAAGDTTATSLPTAAVAGIAPANTVAPTITGGSTPPKVGEALTVNVGTWTGTPVPTFTFQWKAGGISISGATSQGFRPTTTQLGATLTCTVSATNIAGGPVAVTTAATGAVVTAPDVTAPVLTGLTASSISETSAVLAVNTTEGNGILYWVVVPSAAAAPTAAQVKAGTNGSGGAATWAGVVPIGSVDNYDTSPSGLSASTAYKVYAAQQDAAGNYSAVVNHSFSTTGADLTAPVLSDMTADPGVDHRWANLSVTTDTAEGSVFWVVIPAASAAPSSAQIVAGTDGSAVAATYAGSTAVTTLGVQTKTATGLAGGTAYVAYATHRDVALNRSPVVNDAVSTDTVLSSRAHDGLTTGLTPIFSSVLSGSITDSGGGSNAIRVTDGNTGSASATGISYGAVLFLGLVRVRAKVKITSSNAVPVWIRGRTLNMSRADVASFNIYAGGVASVSWNSATCVALSGGWFQLDGFIDFTGLSDVNGLLEWRVQANSASTGLMSDGTNQIDFHEIFATRPT